ncbi:hypothetical protein INT45_001981, partial [Circinella minor]
MLTWAHCILQPATDTTSYTVVYIPSPRRTLHSEIHRALRLVGIAQERVIDVHFPAHRTVGLLIHSSYEQELQELLSQAKLHTKDDFDPIAASTIGDPTLLAKLTEEERANEAQKLYQECMLTMCLCMPKKHLGVAILRHFTLLPTENSHHIDTSYWERFQQQNPPATSNSSTFNRIKVGLLNATGIDKSPDEIIKFCNNNNIDIILITETFLVHRRLHTNWHQYHNYAIQPNPKKRGEGGLSLLVRPDLNLHIHHLPTKNRFTLSFKINTYTFHGLYLPPPQQQLQQANNDHCNELLDQINIDNNTIIFGDINARSKILTGDHQNNSRGLHVLELWSLSNGLHIWNGSIARGQPTFRTNAGHSIIDLFISRECAIIDPIMNIHDMTSLKTHHHLCSLSFTPTSPWQQLPIPNATRQHWKLQRLTDPDVKKLYLTQFEKNIRSTNNQLDNLKGGSIVIPNNATIEQIGYNLVSAIYDALDHTDSREEAYRHWRRSPNIITIRAPLWHKYTACCDKFTKEVRRAQRRTWKQFCSTLGNAPTNEANLQAVETMLTHLSKVFSGERRSDTSMQFLDIDVDNNPFPAVHIEHIINKIAPRKAPGDDHLTGAMLKPLGKPLSHTLSKFFTLCWNWSWIPISWHTAQVVLIYKKNDPTIASKYRPISLTSVIRKLLERCLLPKLLDNMGALDIAQGGFRHHRGSLNQSFALNTLIQQFTTQYNQLPVLAFLDIQSAYDAVDRQIIWVIHLICYPLIRSASASARADMDRHLRMWMQMRIGMVSDPTIRSIRKCS